jgi:tetratricopeptide (TPR) repeat protein
MSDTTPGGSPPSQPNLPGGAKKDDRPDFRVIRSAPQPDAGPSLMPLVLLVLIIALGVGGYMYSQRSDAPADGKTDTKAGTGTSTGTSAPTGDPAPDFIMERVGFYENEQQLERALEYAQEKLATYPNAPNLRAKITELRGKLGLDVLANPEDGLRQVAQRISAGQHAEAVDTLTLLLGGELTEAQQGRAFFLLATAQANLGNTEDARSALSSAADSGYDPAQVKALEEQLER